MTIALKQIFEMKSSQILNIKNNTCGKPAGLQNSSKKTLVHYTEKKIKNEGIQTKYMMEIKTNLRKR